MLAWIGIALLSTSWLVGLGYYHPENGPAWMFLVLAGTALLARAGGRLPSPWQTALAALLAAPALFIAHGPLHAPVRTAPWPYWAPFLLIVFGSALHTVRWAAPWRSSSDEPTTAEDGEPLLVRILGRMSAAAVIGGCVLLVQAVAIQGYMAITARSHDLPEPLARLLGLIARAFGIESGVYDQTVSLFSMRKTHRLGATWELFFDPVTWCFLAGGIVVLGWQAWSNKSSAENASGGANRLWNWAARVALFALPLLLWLPLRTGLLMGLYMNDALRTEYDAPLLGMRLFWSTWVHLALLAGPVLLAWRFVPLAAARPLPMTETPAPRWQLPLAAALVGLGTAILVAGVFWDPNGERKQGRVVIEECHPEGDKQWERTDKPFDTEWYGHMSGYNYYCMYDYSTRFYDVKRHTTPLDSSVLDDCDVLILKVPTRVYSAQEIDAIERFVRRGGGLMLIGEHTNVFRSGDALNSVTQEFGFRYRYDCLFGIDKVYEQRLEMPLVPHPTIQFMPGLYFATSCSIEPQASSGRAAIRSVGLKNKLADYHPPNFYPQPSDSAEMQYGAFVQLWSMPYYKGRVAAFTDSTIFSNFAVFEPGKKELWMGMLEWLNHRSPPVDPRYPMFALGMPIVLAGLWVGRRVSGAWLLLVAAGVLGWCAAVVSVNAAHRFGMPYPEVQRSMVTVAMDQSVSHPELPRNGFIDGWTKPMGFGIFERWILRLGYFIKRSKGPDVFQSTVAVFVRPDAQITDEFRKALVEYVLNGGKVLVLDAPPEEQLGAAARGTQPNFAADPEAPPDSQSDDASSRGTPTTNDLLEPFGLRVDHDTSLSGQLTTSEGWAPVKTEHTAVVHGGQPFAWVDNQPVGTTLSYGDNGGSVTVVGYGWRLSDARMGMTGDVEPSGQATAGGENLRQLYEWEYQMLRAIVEGKPLGKGTPVKASATKP